MKINNAYAISSIEFKRTKESEWEKGLLINDGDVIYDKGGLIPDKVLWDYRRTVGGLHISGLSHYLKNVEFNIGTGVITVSTNF